METLGSISIASAWEHPALRHERVGVPGTGDELQALIATMNSVLDRIETAD
jgi:hypothetical protein